ncbi:ABC-type Na+ efflux pump, permease component [Thermoactinomyces sp. DSM 45891]|uniref:ABC transporter permease n=1 Tax=Thermoactinomyces sp. DSM 45891 TaxID=1761907 RepID=UPI00091CA2C3|nr:ABC transporter permease [Thermoactinomyces sp. DSM 45891]SFX38526.1 ABC-type Na+ efflux pump, permease component [Thermoactinomyces sp. DSM 45891]
MKLMWHIAKKELLEQFRDKRTLWMSILIPLLLIPGIFLLIDRMQSSEEPKIEMGVSSQVPADLQTAIKKSAPGKLELKTMSPEEAKKFMKQGDLTAYLEVETDPSGSPKQWILEIPDDSGYKTVLQSHINQQLLQQYLSQKNISPSDLPKLQMKSAEGAPNIFSGFYLISFLIGVAPLTGGMMIAIDSIAGEKERRTIVSLLGLPVPTWKLWIGKWIGVTGMIMVTTLISVSSLLGIQPYLSSPAIKFDQLISIGSIPLIGFVLCILFYVLVISALLLIMSTFARSFKEAQNYLSPLMMIVLAGTFVIMQQTGSQLPSYLFWIPLWNVHAVLYEILHQSIGTTDIIITFASCSALSLALVAYGAFLFQKPKHML